MRHELKVHSEFWQAIVDDSKPFDIRINDRHFSVGDIVVLRHFAHWGYTEDKAEVRKVTYVMKHEDFPNGIARGYVILGFGYREDE